MKQLLPIISLLLTCLLLLPSCAPSVDVRTTAPAMYGEDGIRITLTEGFRKKSVGDYIGYQAKDVGLLILKEKFSALENGDAMTLSEYADIILQKNREAGREIDELKQEDSLIYFAFTASSGRKNYTYLVSLYRGPDAFWIVQLFAEESLYAEYSDYFFDALKSVAFDEA